MRIIYALIFMLSGLVGQIMWWTYSLGSLPSVLGILMSLSGAYFLGAVVSGN